jgi:CrcB protein
MRTAIWVGVAGFFGSIARYVIQGAVSRVNESFPWGTFVVNITGSFALGFLVAAFAHRFVVHPDLRIVITVGFLGTYTTFSTLTLETFEFAETHAWGVGGHQCGRVSGCRTGRGMARDAGRSSTLGPLTAGPRGTPCSRR